MRNVSCWLDMLLDIKKKNSQITKSLWIVSLTDLQVVKFSKSIYYQCNLSTVCLLYIYVYMYIYIYVYMYIYIYVYMYIYIYICIIYISYIYAYYYNCKIVNALMLEWSKVKFFSILISWDRTFACHTSTE